LSRGALVDRRTNIRPKVVVGLSSPGSAFPENRALFRAGKAGRSLTPATMRPA